MKKLLLALLGSAFLYSCSSPLDKPYNKATAKDDIKEVLAEIDSTEMGVLLGATMLLSMEGKDIEGMTYREILENGKLRKREREAQEAEEKRLAEEAIKMEAERTKRLNGSLTVSLFAKDFQTYRYQDYITYKFAFHNKTEKDIVAFRGEIVFTDLFDKEIASMNMTYDDGIKAGSKINYDATTEYNQFKSSDKDLKAKDLDKLKVIWKPEKILFADGSSME
jgi:hypothetical protein